MRSSWPFVARTRLFALLVVCLPASLAAEWFDDYSRALDALRQRKAARAVELLERAVRQRPEPGANLLTYGTNRLDAYHPYLKLAEAHLMAGNPEAAREALKRSQERGREPAAERARLAAEAAGLERARAVAATPPPATLAAASPSAPTSLPPPPTTVAAVVPPSPPAARPTPAPPPAATPPPGSATGMLDLRTEPPGATALLAGRLLGATPLRVELAPGVYPVTLRKEGAADQSFPVGIVAGQTTSEARTLIATAPAPSTVSPAPEIASLVVYSDPPGATVYLDDEPVGVTDPGSGRLVKSGVAPGAHRLRLARSGRADASQDVVVGPAGPTTARLVLPAVERALPWPALGAGALLVTVFALALLRRRRPAPADAPGSTVALPSRPTKPAPSAAATGPTLTRTPPSAVAPRGTRVPAPTAGLPELELEWLLDENPARPSSPTPGVGERFGDYLLLDQLGKGGMATVYKAERNGEHVALKRPLAAFLEDREFRERFLREAEIGRTLHHPNIIRIFERGHVGGVPYFTMELVVGKTLQAHVRREGALAGKAATRLVAQVAEALDYAHLKGVVHRDLKPSNIMILEDGTVKVMDYGIARARRFEGLTVTGSFLGTPDYVAPETAEGKATDARSDLYSLGVVFYEVLTGRRPFVGDTPFATLSKHVSEPPTPPSVVAPGVPREVEAIVLRLLAKDPNDRYAGAEELLIALRDYLNRAA